MNIKESRQLFIEKGHLILMHELKTSLGEESNLDLTKANKQGHQRIINVMLELIKNASDIEKLQVKNTADVLKAISNGVLSITEAKEMVALLAIIDGKIGDADTQNKVIIQIAAPSDALKIQEKDTNSESEVKTK